MKAHLALVIGFALSFYCLRKDVKQRQQGVSPAIWLPILWFMRCASRAVGLWFYSRGSAEALESDTGSLDPLVLLGFTLVGVWVLWQRRSQLGVLIRKNAVLFVFLGYLTLSVAWSGDMFVSFKRWVRTVGDVTMALLILTEGAPFTALLTVIRRSMVVLIPLSVVLCKYFPDLGRLTSKSWSVPDSWIGVATDKNWLGVLCLLSVGYFAWNWVMRRRNTGFGVEIKLGRVPFEALFVLMSVYLLVGGGGGRAKSMTSIVILAGSVAMFLALDFCRAHNISFLSLLTKVVLCFVTADVAAYLSTGESLPQLVLNALGRNSTLTDRTVFWPMLIEKGMHHPLLGAGFASFWTHQMSLAVEELINIPISQAHNGYLEVFLNLGLIGLFLLLASALKSFGNSYRMLKDDFEKGRFLMLLLVIVLLDNWTEASFGRENQLLWYVFLFAVLAPVAVLNAGHEPATTAAAAPDHESELLGIPNAENEAVR